MQKSYGNVLMSYSIKRMAGLDDMQLSGFDCSNGRISSGTTSRINGEPEL